ncbi:MAG: DUF4012 domain-containing protein [Candidatus Woesebacteria bacterium]
MSDISSSNPQATESVNFSQAFAAHVQTKRGGLSKRNLKFSKVTRNAAIIIGVIVAIVAVGLFFVSRSVFAIKGDLNAVNVTGREAYDAIKVQNLPLADEKLTALDGKLKVLQGDVKGYAWTKAIPFVGAYYKDSERVFTAGFAGLSAAQRMVKEIEPYADVLGFKGQGSFTGGTAEERIGKILETLEKVSPALDAISGDLKTVDESLAGINENRYPETFQGKAVRSKIVQAKSVTNDAYVFLTQNRPAVEMLPEVAGAKGRKKYLVLFQNSGELRPTGGFMTAYAVINVEKGKVQPEGSGDIYELDQKFTNKPAIPPILKQFLTTETKWNLRDMNISPDFKESMTTFNQYYQTIKGQKTTFDGIIAVDTHFLESLLKVIGPVEIPGYGTFSAEIDKRCDCAQILYALSEIVDRPTNFIRENRKGILGPMMASILQKSYGAPKNLWPQLFQTGWSDIEGKHIQFYFFDEKLQAAAENIDAAGRVKPTPENSDYFFIVDTNLAGAKSNFFVQSEAKHIIDVPVNGTLKHMATISYKNPFKASNCNLEAGQLCLNGTLHDWVRVYLPKGAKIESFKGVDESSMKQSDELDHHMVEGTFNLQPLGQAKLELTYTIPYTDTKNYNALIQKQGGTEDWKYTFEVNSEDHDVILDKDKSVSFGF